MPFHIDYGPKKSKPKKRTSRVGPARNNSIGGKAKTVSSIAAPKPKAKRFRSTKPGRLGFKDSEGLTHAQKIAKHKASKATAAKKAAKNSFTGKTGNALFRAPETKKKGVDAFVKAAKGFGKVKGSKTTSIISGLKLPHGAASRVKRKLGFVG